MKIQEVLNLVEFYIQNYRAKDLEKFEIGEMYMLFPNTEDTSDFSWPNKWQFCGNSGVYLFVDKDGDVIYIGETIHFGNRFGSYFGYGNNKECVLKQIWTQEPKELIQIKVPEDSSFERLALEEFLIKNSNPNENRRFNY